MNNPEHDTTPDPQDCPNDCRDGMTIFFYECEIFPEKCTVCNGEGFIPYDAEADLERHNDLRLNILRGK